VTNSGFHSIGANVSPFSVGKNGALTPFTGSPHPGRELPHFCGGEPLDRKDAAPSPADGGDAWEVSERPPHYRPGNEPAHQHTNARRRDLERTRCRGSLSIRGLMPSARSFPGGCSPARNIPKWRRSNSLQESGPMSPNRNASCNRALKQLYAENWESIAAPIKRRKRR
jgi:hypothetical protein